MKKEIKKEEKKTNLPSQSEEEARKNFFEREKEYYGMPGQFNDEASDVIEAGYKDAKIFRKKDQE